MTKMIIKIKKLVSEAVIPKYAINGDAAMDLNAISVSQIDNEGYGYMEYSTGIAIKVPDNHVGLLFPRSSVSTTGLILANSVGVIDSNYTGEIKLRFKYIKDSVKYNIGDRVGQLLIIPIPSIQFEEVDSLKTTERGDGGFGSTNK